MTQTLTVSVKASFVKKLYMFAKCDTTQSHFKLKASPCRAQWCSHSLEKKPKQMSLFKGHTVHYVAAHVFARASASSQFVMTPNSLCPLSILHLLANLVAEDLVPVNLGAGDGELSA